MEYIIINIIIITLRLFETIKRSDYVIRLISNHWVGSSFEQQEILHTVLL